MRATIFAVAGALLLAAPTWAGTISFSGTFQNDDDLVVFHYSVQNLAQVTVQTTSFATGGFIPILSLFDPSGTFKFWSDGYALNSDASLTYPSDAGADYAIVLSQYFNYPLGNLSDGYTYSGPGDADYTTTISGFPGPFRDPSGTQLTGDWTVTFSSPDPTLVASVPEPGTAALLFGGLLIAAAARRRRGRSATH